MSEPDRPSSWVAPVEAAQLVGIPPKALHALIRRGDLPGYRFGRVVRLRREDIDAFVERSKVPVTIPSAPEPPAGASEWSIIEVTRQARRLRAFVDAYTAGNNAPCPVCGEVLSRADLPLHLLGHR